MLNSLLPITAIALYLLATLCVGYFLRSGAIADSEHKSLRLAFVFASIALLMHLAHAYQVSLVDSRLNFGLSSMAVLVSSITVLIYLLGSLAMPIRRLGIMVFPLTILSLAFSHIWHSEEATAEHISGALGVHVLVSILTYCLLAIAAIQALLYVYQERQIKSRSTPAILTALPPLQTMETLLFRLVAMGFALLSLALISGALFSQELFGHAIEFKHHTILAVLGWLVFAVLLFKRSTQGLRGSQAAIWTVGGFLLIQLGYFGTKIVSESLQLQ
ncbi:MAG: ABC-type uncharacterized transport system permease subunit [Cryomorphaceae bacterium]|jgi:ABC-type uncharacterized transport system permease subunit